MTTEVINQGVALASYEYDILGTEGRQVVLKSVAVMDSGDDGFHYAVEVFDEMEEKIDRQVFEHYEQAVAVYKSYRELNLDD